MDKRSETIGDPPEDERALKRPFRRPEGLRNSGNRRWRRGLYSKVSFGKGNVPYRGREYSLGGVLCRSERLDLDNCRVGKERHQG